MQTHRVPALRNRSGQVRTNIGLDLTRCWAERRPARERGKPLAQRHRRPVLSTLTTSPNAYSALGAADPATHPTLARLDLRQVSLPRRRWPAQGRPPHGAPGSPGRIRARPRHAADAPLVPRHPQCCEPGASSESECSMADSAASNSAFVFAAAYLGTRAPRARPFIAIHATRETRRPPSRAILLFGRAPAHRPPSLPHKARELRDERRVVRRKILGIPRTSEFFASWMHSAPRRA